MGIDHKKDKVMIIVLKLLVLSLQPLGRGEELEIGKNHKWPIIHSVIPM
jgi:hypothetical protein